MARHTVKLHLRGVEVATRNGTPDLIPWSQISCGQKCLYFSELARWRFPKLPKQVESRHTALTTRLCLRALDRALHDGTYRRFWDIEAPSLLSGPLLLAATGVLLTFALSRQPSLLHTLLNPPDDPEALSIVHRCWFGLATVIATAIAWFFYDLRRLCAYHIAAVETTSRGVTEYLLDGSTREMSWREFLQRRPRKRLNGEIRGITTRLDWGNLISATTAHWIKPGRRRCSKTTEARCKLIALQLLFAAACAMCFIAFASGLRQSNVDPTPMTLSQLLFGCGLVTLFWVLIDAVIVWRAMFSKDRDSRRYRQALGLSPRSLAARVAKL